MSEHTIKSWIGEDELSVEVSFDYSPAEAKTQFEPGCESNVDNLCIEFVHSGMFRKDITNAINESTLDRLYAECYESVENNNE